MKICYKLYRQSKLIYPEKLGSKKYGKVIT
jgi:hypothetical protein